MVVIFRHNRTGHPGGHYWDYYLGVVNLRQVTATDFNMKHTLISPSGPWSLRWRHNDQDGVSNHQPHGCLLNRLFRRRSKKTSKLRVTGLCVGNSPGPVNSPHKGPVTRKMFPFDDVIMCPKGWSNGCRATRYSSHCHKNMLSLNDDNLNMDVTIDIYRNVISSINGYHWINRVKMA